MIRKSLVLLAVAAIAATAAAPAFADGITIDNSPFQSTRSRAEVRAEAVQAVSEGSTQRGEAYVVEQPAPAGLGKTRAQVREEFEQSRGAGAQFAGEYQAP